ncbi:DUF2271 domain-containing protein [Aestuariibacter sp. A3R04]|uniref:DUF2271 domain-containing protein n=1 Tax=Aestuariibacter sp. A3R04 TaxID=2841571 RepID=UPI001C095B8B|nr:DUF2271 domain-containing protein [Aestuariibacter sp. A3R04]MBU3020555.1 DUF2271 domain-containing protein [Aestuariibacter sp. A3R04]
MESVFSFKTRAVCAALCAGMLSILPSVTSADEVTVTLPRLSVAEYHAPYVAVWLADSKEKRVKDLAVWYDINMENGKGEKWLKDMRLWWRRSGRSAEMPIDGVSGATRRPGEHKINLEGQFEGIAAGSYTLYVEAARELGGREVLSVPVTLPISSSQTQQVKGNQELASIKLSLEPK